MRPEQRREAAKTFAQDQVRSTLEEHWTRVERIAKEGPDGSVEDVQLVEIG